MVTITPDCFKQTLYNLVILISVFYIGLLFSFKSANACISVIRGEPVQGGLILFDSKKATKIKLDSKLISLNQENGFVVGFHRDDQAAIFITGICQDGSPFSLELKPTRRNYKIQKIDQLPNKMVTPPENTLNRISIESKMVKEARSIKGNSAEYFRNGFDWPLNGIITGVYGSQRILNGKSRQPHFGIDIAAPAGTPVTASASGDVVMVENLYFSGWTIIISHGDYISSTYSHLQTISVQKGENINRGEKIGTVGSTGRSTGAHLDWRINWLDKRLDPELIANIKE